MRLKAAFVILGLYLVLISLSGCGTIMGAKEGFSTDLQNLNDIDAKIREILW